jgi:hypothetical protein
MRTHRQAGYVLKRMLLERGAGVQAAGLREVHFGELLRDLPQQGHTGGGDPPGQGHPYQSRLVRFVEHFYRRGAGAHVSGCFISRCDVMR